MKTHCQDTAGFLSCPLAHESYIPLLQLGSLFLLCVCFKSIFKTWGFAHIEIVQVQQ